MTPKPLRAARKAGVAVVGGSLVGVGIVLIPLPGPGTLIVAAGMGVLATEFPAARRALDKAKKKLASMLDGDRDAPSAADQEADLEQ